MGKMQRDKGARFEREVAREFNAVLKGCNAKRGLQTRGGAAECPDVTAGPFAIECKVGKRPPVRTALNTAVEHCPAGHYPMAIIKEDRRQPFAVVMLDDLLDILEEWWQLKCQ